MHVEVVRQYPMRWIYSLTRQPVSAHGDATTYPRQPFSRTEK
jgi:hypothetical protein